MPYCYGLICVKINSILHTRRMYVKTRVNFYFTLFLVAKIIKEELSLENNHVFAAHVEIKNYTEALTQQSAVFAL
jgi:hypothetical protein